MSRPLAKSSIVLSVLALLVFGSSAAFSDDDNLEALNRQTVELFQ